MTKTFKAATSSLRTNLVLTSTVGIILLTGLSGCMLDRVRQVRSQFCDFEQNFAIEFGAQPSVVMINPVLLDQDVLWLLGADPTLTVFGRESKTVSWVFEEAVAVPDSSHDLRFDMDFRLIDGNYRLHRISVDPKLNDWLSPDSLNREALLSSAQQICSTGLSFQMTSMEFDIPKQEIDQLPDRSELLASIGQPHDPLKDGGGWSYRYRVKGSTDDRQTAHFTVWFDEFTQKPLRMESQYWRYRGEADFSDNKLSLNMEL